MRVSPAYCSTGPANACVCRVCSKCIKQTLNPVWQDSFELDMLHDGQVLSVDVYDRDWVLGIPLKPDYIGRVSVELRTIPATVRQRSSPTRARAWLACVR